MKIPFSPPRIYKEIIDEVVDTLQSGWITTGPKTLLFEKKISEYCNVQEAVCLSSATAALLLCLEYMGLCADDEVIVPAYTYSASANVVRNIGAKLILVDIGNKDFNINIEKIREKITAKTKVIIPVDIAGIPVKYDELFGLVNSPEIKEKYNPNNEIQSKLGRILILADSAHSFGAIYNDKKIGEIADMTCFSFHAVKNLSTAEGGAICINMPKENFNHSEIKKYLKTMSLHGQSKDALDKMKAGAWKYDIIKSGFKCNMTDIQSSMGIVELRHYQENLDKRKLIIDNYNMRFENIDWAITQIHDSNNYKSSYHLYLLRISDITEIQRDDIISHISQKDVSVNVHFQPLPLLTAFKNEFDINDFNNSYQMYMNEITLPVYYDLSIEMSNYVVDSLIDAYNTVVLKK